MCINAETLETATGRLKDEQEDHIFVSYDKTRCWNEWRTCSTTSVGGKRWRTYSYRAHGVNDGRQCASSVDDYETVWPLFQVQTGIRGHRLKGKLTSSVELVRDLRSIRGHFTLDQRGSNVLAVQERSYPTLTCLPKPYVYPRSNDHFWQFSDSKLFDVFGFMFHS